jgi:hypothetical protein
MAPILLGYDNLDVTGQVYAALEEGNEACNQCFYKITGLRKKLEFMPIGSKATVAENNHDRSKIDSPHLLLGNRPMGSIE